MTEHSLSPLHTNVQILCRSSFIKAPNAPVGRCEQHAVRCSNKALFLCGLSLTSVISAMQTRQLVCMLVIACKYNNSFFHSWMALLFVLSIAFTYCWPYLFWKGNPMDDIINYSFLWGGKTKIFKKKLSLETKCKMESFILIFLQIICTWLQLITLCFKLWISFFLYCAWRQHK